MWLINFCNIDEGTESFLFRRRDDAHKWLVAEIKASDDWRPRDFDRSPDDPLYQAGDVARNIADLVVGTSNEDGGGSWSYNDDLYYTAEEIDFTEFA